jgi:hypothetical protein
MKTYEYIRLYFDFRDLKDLNALGSAGWRVVTVSVSQDPAARFGNIALLQRAVSCIKHRQMSCPWCLFDSDRYGDKEVPVAA